MSVTAIDAIRQAAILSQQIEVQLLPHIELLQQILFEMLQVDILPTHFDHISCY